MSFWPNTGNFQQLLMSMEHKQSKHKQTNIMQTIIKTKHSQIYSGFTIKQNLMTWTETLIHLTHQFRPIIVLCLKTISIYVIFILFLFLFIILLLLLYTNKVLLVSCKNNSDSNQINHQQRFIQRHILQTRIISKI